MSSPNDVSMLTALPVTTCVAVLSGWADGLAQPLRSPVPLSNPLHPKLFTLPGFGDKKMWLLCQNGWGRLKVLCSSLALSPLLSIGRYIVPLQAHITSPRDLLEWCWLYDKFWILCELLLQDCIEMPRLLRHPWCSQVTCWSLGTQDLDSWPRTSLRL